MGALLIFTKEISINIWLLYLWCFAFQAFKFFPGFVSLFLLLAGVSFGRFQCPVLRLHLYYHPVKTVRVSGVHRVGPDGCIGIGEPVIAVFEIALT